MQDRSNARLHNSNKTGLCVSPTFKACGAPVDTELTLTIVWAYEKFARQVRGTRSHHSTAYV